MLRNSKGNQVRGSLDWVEFDSRTGVKERVVVVSKMDCFFYLLDVNREHDLIEFARKLVEIAMLGW